MRKLIRRTSRKAGLPPGSLVHVGERTVDKTQISVLDYAADHIEEAALASADQCVAFKDKPTVTWINMTGLHDVDVLQRIGECYGIHPLVLEDILNTQQRPKVEDFDDYLFVVLKMIDLDPETKEITAEQISLVVGDNFVLSFQEAPGDVFENVRERLRSGRRRIRERGTDYLGYALLDAVVDHYFVVLEALGNHIEDLEDELVKDPDRETLHAIYTLKRELIYLRRSVWPLREVLSFLSRGEARLVQQETVAYLRDVYDHTIQVIDTIESFRDIIGGMHDTYLSSISNRMNEVMKVLTIFASIFIPLTFVAGVYGMNFEYMPELHWRWSYPALLGFMIVATMGMLVFFRKRKWL
jgi:magnesium transporter